jgi:hypothetical protein
MEYAHEEVIRELGITVNDLPSEIKNKIRTWNNKKRMASRPETIELLTDLSVDIADDIAAWHYVNSGEEEEDESEEEEEEETPKPIVVTPIVEQPQNIVSHVANPEVVEQHEEEEKKESGWGLKNLSNW